SLPLPREAALLPAQADSPAPANDAARVQAAYRRGEAPAATPEAAALPRAEDATPRHAAAAGVQALPTGEVIHPQAATVVHQQLDLLATAVFRWSGQAWPGVPIAWSIEEEGADPHGSAMPDEDNPRRWSTTVSFNLPRLGAVDLRLSLTASMVQARLAANEASTLARLRSDSGRLVQRFEAAGLRLQDLQITAMSAS
ncbi:flagellar hook-length control protein FliK, partial [Variovorax paradoxus]|nr:flagellar hook-length control protein FliK [Variovorax paradoxus]